MLIPQPQFEELVGLVKVYQTGQDQELKAAWDKLARIVLPWLRTILRNKVLDACRVGFTGRERPTSAIAELDSATDLAAELGVSRKVVKDRIARTRDALKKILLAKGFTPLDY